MKKHEVRDTFIVLSLVIVSFFAGFYMKGYSQSTKVVYQQTECKPIERIIEKKQCWFTDFDHSTAFGSCTEKDNCTQYLTQIGASQESVDQIRPYIFCSSQDPNKEELSESQLINLISSGYSSSNQKK